MTVGQIGSETPRSGYAEVEGTRLYYERLGSGLPLVLVHAGIADRRMWDEQLPAFAEHFDTIVYDARGFGKSEMGAGVRLSSDDLHGLLSELGIPRAILLGCSVGGTTVLDFAIERPGEALGLILVAAVPSGYELRGQPPQKVLEFVEAYQQGKLDQATELATQIWLDGPRRDPSEASPRIRRRAREMIRDVLAARALDLTGERLGTTAAVNRLAEIRVPTLVVVGELDDPSIAEAGECLAAGIPNAERTSLPECAHLPSVEAPGAFNQIVLDFLGRAFGKSGADDGPD